MQLVDLNALPPTSHRDRDGFLLEREEPAIGVRLRGGGDERATSRANVMLLEGESPVF